MLDAILITDRLVITVLDRGRGPLRPATPWYPAALDARAHARGGAAGGAGPRLGDAAALSGARARRRPRRLRRLACDGRAPHLAPEDRDALARAYLGELTYTQARAVTGG